MRVNLQFLAVLYVARDMLVVWINAFSLKQN